MAKPVLLSVDDDADVLRAIERDLRSKYGAGKAALTDIDRYLDLGLRERALASAGLKDRRAWIS